MIRILVSYATAGTGHLRAAEAVAEAIRRVQPQAEVVCEDFLGHVPPWLRRSYPATYEWAVRHAPWLWGLLYQGIDHAFGYRLVQPWRRRWNRRVAAAALRAVRRQPPEVIVATHFFPADVYAQAKRQGWLRARLIVVVTDLFPHRLWLAPEAEAFVVGSEQTALLCRRKGVEAHRLHVMGIPIRARFRRMEGPAQEAQKCALGLEPALRTILMLGGGMGVGPLEQLTTRLAALEATRPGRLQLLVVCGYNQPLEDRLAVRAKEAAMPMRVFGYIDTIHELMAVSDLIISKPGGVTVAETLAMGLPMVICGTIPGQEQFNAEELVRYGAGIMVRDVEEAVALAAQVCDDPRRLAAMRERALAWGKPQAAEEIAELALHAGGS